MGKFSSQFRDSSSQHLGTFSSPRCPWVKTLPLRSESSIIQLKVSYIIHVEFKIQLPAGVSFTSNIHPLPLFPPTSGAPVTSSKHEKEKLIIDGDILSRSISLESSSGEAALN